MEISAKFCNAQIQEECENVVAKTALDSVASYYQFPCSIAR